MSILVIEEDMQNRKLLKKSLSEANFVVKFPISPIDLAENIPHDVDAIIIDLHLSVIDAISLCSDIRMQTKVPIIVSSHINDVAHKIRAFDVGVDDYMTKPYHMAELVARVRALLRRMDTREMIFGNLNVDAKRRMAKLHDQSLDLTNTEFDILLFLIENRLQPISRDRIALTINAIHEETGLRSIDTHIRNIRNKLGDSAKSPKYIQSVWGVGYKFCL